MSYFPLEAHAYWELSPKTLELSLANWELSCLHVGVIERNLGVVGQMAIFYLTTPMFLGTNSTYKMFPLGVVVHDLGVVGVFLCFFPPKLRIFVDNSQYCCH